jgi:hypothetical protein
MIESVFVVILTCLCFLAIFQYAHLFACKTILSHAATRSARARSVGFDRDTLTRSMRVAAIPACGRRLTPPSTGIDPAITAALRLNRVGEIWDLALRSSTRAPGTQLEVARVPDYMDSINEPTGEQILDYELWDTLSLDVDEPLNPDGTTPGILTVTVRQRHPLLIALAPLAEGELRDAPGQSFAIQGLFSIESHYPLYMENMNW